jgi:hypothetical protein
VNNTRSNEKKNINFLSNIRFLSPKAIIADRENSPVHALNEVKNFAPLLGPKGKVGMRGASVGKAPLLKLDAQQHHQLKKIETKSDDSFANIDMDLERSLIRPLSLEKTSEHCEEEEISSFIKISLKS